MIVSYDTIVKCLIIPRRRRRLANICLTCFSVPEGLGVICAPGAAGDSTNYAKGNVRLKQLLGKFPFHLCLFIDFRYSSGVCINKSFSL